MLYKILIFVFAFACGSAVNYTNLRSTEYVDPALEPYVLRFERYCGVQVSGMRIFLGKTNRDKNKIGYCQGNHTIVIDRGWWQEDQTDHIKRELLMLHELGHCVLDCRHNNEIIGDSPQPESIMHEYPLSVAPYFVHHKKYYIDELCNCGHIE